MPISGKTKSTARRSLVLFSIYKIANNTILGAQVEICISAFIAASVDKSITATRRENNFTANNIGVGCFYGTRICDTGYIVSEHHIAPDKYAAHLVNPDVSITLTRIFTHRFAINAITKCYHIVTGVQKSFESIYAKLICILF